MKTFPSGNKSFWGLEKGNNSTRKCIYVYKYLTGSRKKHAAAYRFQFTWGPGKERQYCIAPPPKKKRLAPTKYCSGFLIAMYRLYGPFPFGVHTQKMVISIRVWSISSPLPKTNCETIITICTRTSSIKLPNVDWFVSAHCTVRKFRYLVSYVQSQCTSRSHLLVYLPLYCRTRKEKTIWGVNQTNGSGYSKFVAGLSTNGFHQLYSRL